MAKESLKDLLGDNSSFTSMSPRELEYFKQILQEEIRRREEDEKPIQIRDIVDIETWLRSPYYLPDCDKIYPYWREALIDIFRSDRDKDNNINQVILAGCFTGDTRVALLDGTFMSFKELEEKYGMGKKKFLVYSMDSKGYMRPGKAHSVHKTKLNQQIMHVVLDGLGEVIRCTPDHKFLLTDGTYEEAQNLTSYHELMPFNSLTPRRVSEVYMSDEYEDVYDLEVDEYHNFALEAGVFVHNSIGTGKSTIANIILMRKLYELSCFKNVPSLFHLMSSSSIMFIYFSINMTQAERTGFGFFRSTVDACPYFKDYFRRKPRLDSLLVFPENIKFAYGSSTSTSIGTNTLASLIDEANFIGGYGGGYGNTEKASELYTSMLNRTASRFIMDGGMNHSLNILVSSSTSTGSITEQVINRSKDDPHTFIAAPAQWEVKPDKFSKKFFFVCKGTEYLEPHVVYSTDDVNNFRISEGLPKEKYVDNLDSFEDIEKEIHKLPPHMQSKYLKVPEDLRKGFETSIIRSLQDLGGVSTGSTGKLFTSVSVFNDCIDNERFSHPFVSNEIVVSTGDKTEVKDYLKSSFHLKHPERPRFIHIDQSYRTDSTGISCVYVDSILEDENGMKKPVIGVDFMLRINPPSPPRKIAIYKIRNFIVWLGTSFGMKIGKVTYDIFNSEESRQILEEMGFNVGYQSVDRTDKAYLDLVEIMYEGRLKMYDYPILRYELFNLIHYRDKRKVDHPKVVSSDPTGVGAASYNGKGSGVGSKDTADSLCGAIENLLQFSIAEESGAYINRIEDFLYANSFKNGDFEFDALSAEDLIDRQIDNMIEDFEYGDTTGFLNGTQSGWF